MQKLRALAALPEDLGLIPGTHRVAHNYLYLQSQVIQQPILASESTAHTWCIDIYAGKTIHHTK